MTSRWILFVSVRHFRTKRREKGHTAGVLSVLGIAAGVMTLISVLAVMNGFQHSTIEDILEVGSFHVQVTGVDPVSAARQIGALAGVRAAVPFAEQHSLLAGYFRDPVAAVVRGVPDTIGSDDEGFARSLEIVSGRFALDEPSTVVLGEELARRIGARVGDTVELVGFDLIQGAAAGAALVSPRLDVIGVFKTGFLEYDAGWSFVSLDTSRSLLGTPAGTVGVKLRDRFADRVVTARIRDLFPDASVESWREYNRAIFGALRLEKTLMMLLIGLIFVVVAVNIYQSLRRSVMERTEEIGVLKALGASPLALQLVFVFEGVWIGAAGATIGTVLGVIVSANINRIFAFVERAINAVSVAAAVAVGAVSGAGVDGGGFSVFSPSYFYLDEVPAVLVAGEVVTIAVVAVLSATVAAYGASRRAGRITPAEVLRYE
ncbi:MAG: ABC transporter permease [Spirochaetaceae bacterium]|nr:MAG: ABC transporter permease [Spirochaetaceae bacterium]